MMECNKEEAVRAKEIAEKKMESRDFAGALKIASKAQRLYPDLDNIEQMILVCDVHCASENKIDGSESDWYDILKVDPTANIVSVKKQYRKFALSLHPDKNKFPGAADAFRIIGEAQKVLLDHEKRAQYDNKRAAVGKSSRQSEQPTFWTVCNNCSVKYQYHTEMKNRTLWCQHCRSPFIALEINSPRATNSNRPNDTTAQSYVKINPQTVPVKLVPKTTAQGKSVNHKTKANLQENKMKGRTNRNASVESNSEQYPRRTTRSRQHVPHSEDLNDDDVLANSSKRSKTVRSSSEEENSEELFMYPSRPSASTGTGPPEFEYPSSDLSDFDKDRAQVRLKTGQIWAFYDVLDCMPRFYAIINKIFFPVFKSEVTWLEPYPDNEDEKKWVLEGLPAACGRFRLGCSETITDFPMLSHMVLEKHTSQNTYEIYPKKGETWALFLDWDMNWPSRTETKTEYEYEFVEVLSDYTDGGVHVAPLVKVRGFVCLFNRKKEKESILIPKNELFRFSHKVPSFQMTEMERKDVPEGAFELDPACLPLSIMDKH